MLTLPVPELVSVMDFAGLWLPTKTLPKPRLVALEVSCEATLPDPVPLATKTTSTQ
jgi:hypothetical protein